MITKKFSLYNNWSDCEARVVFKQADYRCIEFFDSPGALPNLASPMRKVVDDALRARAEEIANKVKDEEAAAAVGQVEEKTEIITTPAKQKRSSALETARAKRQAKQTLRKESRREILDF